MGGGLVTFFIYLFLFLFLFIYFFFPVYTGKLETVTGTLIFNSIQLRFLT